MRNNKMIPISAKNIKKLSDTFAKKNVLKHQTILQRDVNDTTLIYKKQSNTDMNMILEILYHMKTMQYTANSSVQMTLQKQQIQNILNVSIAANELKEVKDLLLSEKNWNTVLIEKAINCVENILKKNSIWNHKEKKQKNFNIFHSNDYFFNIINSERVLNEKDTFLKKISFENKMTDVLKKVFTFWNNKNTKYQISFQKKINTYFVTMVPYLKENAIQKNNFFQIKIIKQNKWIREKEIIKEFVNNPNNKLQQQNYFLNNKIEFDNSFLYCNVQNKNKKNVFQKQVQYALYNYNRKYKNTEIYSYNKQQFQNIKQYFTIGNAETFKLKQILQNKNVKSIKKKQEQHFYKILNFNSANKNIKKYLLSIQNKFWKKKNNILFDTSIKKFHLVQLFDIKDIKFFLFKSFYKKLKQQRIKFKILEKALLQYRQYNNSIFYSQQYKNSNYKIIKKLQKHYWNNKNNSKNNSFYNILYQIKTIEYYKKNKLYSNQILQNKIQYFDWGNIASSNLYYNKKEILNKKENIKKRISENTVLLSIKNLLFLLHKERTVKQQNLVFLKNNSLKQEEKNNENLALLYQYKILKLKKEKNTFYKNLLLQKKYVSKEKIHNKRSIIILNKDIIWNLEKKETVRGNIIYIKNLLLEKKSSKIGIKQNKITLNKNIFWSFLYKEIEKQEIKNYKNLLLEKKSSKIGIKQNKITLNKNIFWNFLYKEIEKEEIKKYRNLLLEKKSSKTGIKQNIVALNKNIFWNFLYKEIKKEEIKNYENLLLEKKDNKIENKQGTIINKNVLWNLLKKDGYYIKNLLLEKKNSKIEIKQNLVVLNKNTFWNFLYKSIKKEKIKYHKSLLLLQKKNTYGNIESTQDIVIFHQNILWHLLYKQMPKENIIHTKKVLLQKEHKKNIKNKKNIVMLNKNKLLQLFYKKKKEIIQYKNLKILKNNSSGVQITNKQSKLLFHEYDLIKLFYQYKQKEIMKIYEKILLKKENIKYKIKQNFSAISQKSLLYSKKQIDKTMAYKQWLYLLYNQEKITAIQFEENNLLWKEKSQENNIAQITMQNAKNEIEKTEKSLIFLKNRKQILNKEKNITTLQKKEVVRPVSI